MKNKLCVILGMILILLGMIMMLVPFLTPNMFVPSSLEIAHSYQIVIKSMAYLVGALSFVIVGVGLLKISKK